MGLKQQANISATNFASPKKALVRQESEPKEQRSDRSENRSLKEALSEPLRRRKNGFVSSRFLELFFLLRRGAHFCKSLENIWPESEKCTLKTLDGEFDASMCGLGGAKKRKC